MKWIKKTIPDYLLNEWKNDAISFRSRGAISEETKKKIDISMQKISEMLAKDKHEDVMDDIFKNRY